MHFKSFRWNYKNAFIEMPAEKVFDMSDVLCTCPNVGISDDGAEYIVTHAYADDRSRYIRFEGGYKEPFVMAERQ